MRHTPRKTRKEKLHATLGVLALFLISRLDEGAVHNRALERAEQAPATAIRQAQRPIELDRLLSDEAAHLGRRLPPPGAIVRGEDSQRRGRLRHAPGYAKGNVWAEGRD
jgi:hypothetical protein